MINRLAIVLQLLILGCITLPGQDTLTTTLVSLDFKNATVLDVLEEITYQSGFNFTFNANLVPDRKAGPLELEQVSLNKALDSILKDSSLTFSLVDRNIVIYKKNTVAASPLLETTDRAILHGKITDSHNGKVLEYATIALSGTSLGTVSNLQGEFSFKIPARISDPILVISHMGYKLKYVPVNYPVDEDLVIQLEKELIPIQEVIIRFADPVLLIKEALRKIPENYAAEPAVITAFYRESVKRDRHHMSMTEAVLEIAKSPYDNDNRRDQVRIHKGRKITDISSADTVLIKLHSGVYSSLGLDIIKDRPDFLREDFLEMYKLEYSDLISRGAHLLYVFSFEPRNSNSDLYFQGKLYVDQESLAIIAADFEYPPSLIQDQPELFLVNRSPRVNIKPLQASYHVEYRETGGRFHISQVRADLVMKVKKRRKWISSRYRISIEMAVTGIEPGKEQSFPKGERIKPNTILSEEPFEFDPQFWGIYNTIEPDLSLQESIRRMEKFSQEIQE